MYCPRHVMRLISSGERDSPVPAVTWLERTLRYMDQMNLPTGRTAYEPWKNVNRTLGNFKKNTGILKGG